MMAQESHRKRPDGPGNDLLHFPAFRRPPDRHLLIGISHASDDPARHRTFEIRASYDVERGGWIARAGEQNLNEQRGDWQLIRAGEELPTLFPSAAACLGHAVTTIVETVDQEADDEP